MIGSLRDDGHQLSHAPDRLELVTKLVLPRSRKQEQQRLKQASHDREIFTMKTRIESDNILSPGVGRRSIVRLTVLPLSDDRSLALTTSDKYFGNADGNKPSSPRVESNPQLFTENRRLTEIRWPRRRLEGSNPLPSACILFVARLEDGGECRRRADRLEIETFAPVRRGVGRRTVPYAELPGHRKRDP